MTDGFNNLVIAANALGYQIRRVHRVGAPMVFELRSRHGSAQYLSSTHALAGAVTAHHDRAKAIAAVVPHQLPIEVSHATFR